MGNQEANVQKYLPMNRKSLLYCDINTSKEGITVMSKHPIYTQEQVAILASNPYTRDVSQYRISFTVEFKRFILEERDRSGKPWKEIFRLAGYDPEIISKARRDRIVIEARKQAASPQGLRAPASKPRKTASDNETLRKTVKDLRDEIEILNQKVEFLKKTVAVRQRQGLQK